MGCINVELNRLGNTPTASVERVGVTPTAEIDYLGGLPVASLIDLGGVPSATLEYMGGMSIGGGLLCQVGNDTLAISDSSFEFSNEDVGATKTFSVMASSDWTAELVDPNGLFTLNTSYGVGGIVGKIAVTLAKDNALSFVYYAQVVVRSEGMRRVLTMAVQAGADAYTRLTYIEATGAQYIDLGYIMQEGDVIEMDYVLTVKDTTAKCLFGTTDGSTRTWVYFHGGTGYISCGTTSDVQKSTFNESCSISLSKGSAVVDGATTAISSYSAMPQNEMYLFAYKRADGEAASFGVCRCMRFAIKRGGQVIMELRPNKREGDGKVGMLDMISGTFYVNAGTGDDFAAGAEIKISDGYELIDYVTFSKDRLYDLGIVNSNYTLEVLFRRSESSSAIYLYGCITSPHTASVTAYLTTSGSWRYGSTYRNLTMTNTRAHRVAISAGKIVYDLNSATFGKSTFTTPNTVVLGGSRSASGSLSKGYQGRVYYFRITQNTTAIKDLYPCKRLSDGVEGFWDCVSQTFVAPM